MTGVVWPDVIETERLRLRPARLDDAPGLFEAYAGDARVTHYLTWRPNASVDEVRAFLAGLVERTAAMAETTWILEMAGDPAPIGMLSARTGSHGVEVGYVLAEEHWGRGLMTEALRAVVALAQQEPTVFRIWAYRDVDHPASGRVLEKAGLAREAVLRRWVVHPNLSDEPRDAVIHSWTR